MPGAFAHITLVNLLKETKRIDALGGGQLGRLFTVAARTMGYRVLVLDPDSQSPAVEVADVHLKTDYEARAARTAKQRGGDERKSVGRRRHG